MSTAEAAGFRREISRWQIVALSLNDVVGSGVYLLPAAAAAVLGTASPWAVLGAGLAVFLIVLCFAESASHFDQPGSAYLYAKTAWGDLVGFEVGFMTWLARVASVASLAVGFADAVSFLLPSVKAGVPRVFAIVFPILVLAAINVFGVKGGTRAAVALVIGKLTPLLIFIGVGVLAVIPDRLLAPASVDPTRFGEAALLLMFAYAGFENTAAPAGEFKNPRRDVPFALFCEIGIVTALYLSVQVVTLGVLADPGATKTPLADAGRFLLGPFGGLLMTVGAAISILGTNSNTILSGPRYLWALANEGFGPAFLARISPRFHTPDAAIVFMTLVIVPLSLSGSFKGLAALSIVARLTTYISTAAAVLVLRRKLGEPRVRLPFGPVIPAAAVLVCLGLAASATTRNLVAGAVALVVGLGIYAARSPRPGDGRPEGERGRTGA